MIFTFDGDAAGMRAAERAFTSRSSWPRPSSPIEESGLDPCELRQKAGDLAVRDLVARRQPVYEFAIRSEISKHNLETDKGRLAALDAVAPIIGRIKDEGLRATYAVARVTTGWAC